MASSSFLVIRIHPDSPVDGGTFGTYLDGLQIQVYPADEPQTAAHLLGQTPVALAPLTLTPVPLAPGTFIAAVTKLVTTQTSEVAANDFGKQLVFADADGIPVGAVITAADSSQFQGGTIVTAISAPTNPPTSQTVTLSKSIPKSVAAGTVVTFFFEYTGITPTWGSPNPSFSIQQTVNPKATNTNTVSFNSIDGVSVGMQVSAASGVPAGTEVLGATGTSLTLSNNVTLAKNAVVTFTWNLNTGIVQHYEQSPLSIFGLSEAPIPQAVATAVIVLNPAPAVNTYLDVAIVAIRNGQTIPVDTEFFNVIVTVDNLPTPDQYQGIALTQTSLYLTLPAPPLNTNAIALTIPSDGTAPRFDDLFPAMQKALSNDPYFTGADILNLTADQCTRMAYDIVWSQQNTLPAPPDPLESLYTNPPNTGGSSGSGSSDEQDRQKFEGAVNSFYSKRNSNAERLAKFVAAASAALNCENLSLNATEALLEFPVDPATLPNPSPVASEVLLTGLSPTGVNFAVPAGFFYALGNKQDKNTSATARYQIATGDTAERVLQELGQAVSTHVIAATNDDSEHFALPLTTAINTHPTITAVQAVRRLAALRVDTSVSTSPQVALPAAGPLVDLVNAWLAATTQQTPSYKFYTPGVDDDTIWALLVVVPPPANLVDAGNLQCTAQPNEAGFLLLDLGAMTRGFAVGGVTLASKIAGFLPGPNPTVTTLKNVTAAQWTAFFTTGPANASWLPPFVQPAAANTPPGTTPSGAGYISACIKSFIRAVQKFFTVSSVPNAGPTLTPGAPSTFDLPAFDAITMAALPAGFTFGSRTLTAAEIAAAVSGVFSPGTNAHAEAWLTDKLTTLSELYLIAKVVPEATPNASPVPGDLPFSVMEALYARGFRYAKDITALSKPEFQQALTGTVAYPYAIVPATLGGKSLYDAAAAIALPGTTSTQGNGTFTPINPDGSLTNCIPAPCSSPLGPIAYLSEMLQVSESSTCEDPLTPSAKKTLGSVVSQRRGPIGDNLDASCANLETPLPMIDIVNECLEFMGSLPSPTNGTVYNTNLDGLAGHAFQHHKPCEDEEKEASCHDAAKLLAALPEYSTPATPVDVNSAVEPLVYNNLKSDFSSCCLPYSQALDVSRTYLRHFRTCRFEEMRAFRKCITEFVLDPVGEPPGFQSHLWRYPVRIDTAIEYLGITPEEYAILFWGADPQPCASFKDGSSPNNPAVTPPSPREANAPGAATAPPPSRDQSAATVGLPVWKLYGFASAGDTDPWTSTVVKLPEFLERTCLTYCEFYELWQSGFVSFRNGDDKKNGAFPQCEPCCLDKLWLEFGEGGDNTQSLEQSLLRLAVFIRLWRKLKESCCFCYSFAQLRDICDVLVLFNKDGINPDFIRQLVAFQMLRDHFRMELTDSRDKTPASAIDADRTHLLALWVGPTATKWDWAVNQLIDRIQHYARHHHKCGSRSAEFIKILASNLDPLSQLAGFDPASATDNWHALPTHTLRFAEVLAKVYASNFSIGEVLYLFTAGSHLDGDDPFPLQEENEALDAPLGLPDEQTKFSLWHLRRRLLEATTEGEDVEQWHWKRIEAALQDEFGFALSDIQALGHHFFPGVLGRAGYQVDGASRSFVSSLPSTSTSTQMWNVPADGPFHYDPGAGGGQLSTRVPLTDEAVNAKLMHVHSLNDDEQKAVQDLCFQPRAMLATFALLFSDFAVAEERLVEERDEKERWEFFQKQFVLCRHRCRIIAEHLTHHVAAATGQECPEGDAPALLILRELFADENKATADWENDDGTPPSVTWTPPPNGGAFAALLGLTGTGLVVEYKPAGGAVVWRSVSGPLSGFGKERDRENCPVPAVLPSMSATLTPQQMQFVSVHNGFLMKDATGAWLGGAQGFDVNWSGALLVEHEGSYEFWAGAPMPGDEKPDFEVAERRAWRVVLKRGQRTWVLLSHHWPGDAELHSTSLPLKRGAYELTVEMRQPAPEFHSDEDVRPQQTGFQIKYAGPDSHGQRVEIPHTQLFSIKKDGTLRGAISPLSAGATSFLDQLYTSSLRDIRRTYQRAFKAVLFAHRFALSARRKSQGTSELGYMLAQKENFAGVAYYRDGSGFKRHAADFDFNFLPLEDDYYPPAQDSREKPKPQRIQAMFDWWERLFDYAVARREVLDRCDRHLWHLFEEAEEKQPAHPAYLLRHMGADSRHWHLDLRYYQGQAVVVYEVTSNDLEDERWTLRAWHADRWLRALVCNFAAKDITVARPDLWASDDPSAPVDSEKETGNANLSSFVCDGCLENGEPRRFEDVKRLNDCLRQRGRNALLAYLCHMNRVALPWTTGQFAQVPRDLSDLLLLDVESGLCEKASRIEEAITAVQNYIRRARLGLEPEWNVHSQFARLWDGRFATYRIWEACKRRELYKENWVDWDELEAARRVEAFRFLESGLRRATLTIAEPGGGEWWPDERPPKHDSHCALQSAEPSGIQQLPPAPPTPEGWTILGTPERDAQPSWLAVPSLPSSGGSSQSAPETGAPSGGDQTSANQTPLALAKKTAQDALPANLPFWLEAAIRLGTQFIRIAAAGEPAGSSEWDPESRRRHRGCCVECGCMHAPLVDEYYFWLIPEERYVRPDQADGVQTSTPGSYQFGIQDSFYDQSQQQSAQWNDPTNLPLLLHWPSNPAVRLAWCRVHNGEFGQPRRSVDCVSLQTGAGASPGSLQLLGRGNDSLYFTIQGAASAPSGDTDASPPGFRYDLPDDSAVALPLAVPATKPPATYPGSLPAYPFFAFDSPGASLFPSSLFAPAVAVANSLRTHCRFELALKWYELAFAPLQSDCTWIDCGKDDQTPPPKQPPEGNNPNNPNNPANPDNPQAALGVPPVNNALVNAAPADRLPGGGSNGGACCDSTKVSRSQAKDRSILLHYLETLAEWGDAVMRRGNCPEAFQQARVIFDTAGRILGRNPCNVPLREPAVAQKVSGFKPEHPPLNPRLLDLYAIVRDRLDSIRACMNSRRLHNGQVDCEMPYFGNDPVPGGWRTSMECCAEEGEWCLPRSPYRFTFRIQKALQLAGAVRELGSALLSAYEKGDAEYLASLRAEHEREMMALGIAVRQEQWRDADWQIQALQQTKNLNQANLVYYTNLYQNGFINDEIQYQVLTTTAMQTRTGANTVEAVGEAMKVIPDLFVGFPCTDTQVPIGTKLAGVFETIAKVMTVFADIQKSTSELDLTLAGWDRRSDDWQHQTQTLPIEIEQIELQILGAQRRRGQALLELNNQQRQVEQSNEVLNFLRDKFTSDKLYLFVQRETSELYRRTYDLALYAARQAEGAFNFERGYTSRRFLPEETWNTLHEGLLAGERLECALHHMEKAYCDENVREYELTKHFSLRRHFPMEFLRLRNTGRCEIDIPEWMFDLDFPGHYMRRIKNVTLTIPCVTGPYTGVHCRLTLISSVTRVHPRLSAPQHECCCPPEPCGCDCREDERLAREYRPCPDDPRMVRHYSAHEAIATSTAQNDSGLFELNFNDERYLPFEYLGAVSRWRIELPQENNYFDFDSLSECIIRLNYTAREGGELLRRAANAAAHRHLPGDGWCLFDVRHEFPDAWQLFRDSAREKKSTARLRLRFDRKMFPFVPGGREVWISKIGILFDVSDYDDCGCPKSEGCPCPESGDPACRVVEFSHGHQDRDDDCKLNVPCLASDCWPDLYYGIVDTHLGPLGGNGHCREVEFRFPAGAADLEHVFLLCRYTLKSCAGDMERPQAVRGKEANAAGDSR